MATPLGLSAYLLLFVGAGFAFLFINLLVGRLVRPQNPEQEKLEVYECGEPTIGSSFIQFDLRFYVVALVFIVFDVEVAFLFPLATVYGKATALMDRRVEAVVQSGGRVELSPAAADLYRELGLEPSLSLPAAESLAAAEAVVRETAWQLAAFSFVAINIFFLVLLVGFAYEWKCGAFDWVRALTQERRERYRGEPRRPARDEAPGVAVTA